MAGSGPGKLAWIKGDGGAPAGFLLYNFDPGRAELKREHEERLREVVARVLESGRNRVHLIGRASSTEAVSGLGLGMERAENVARFLHQIPSLKIPSGNLDLRSQGVTSGIPVGPEEDRGVVIYCEVDPSFVVGLRKDTRVPGIKWTVVEQVIREAIGPMAEQARRTLKFSGGTGNGDDLKLNFVDVKLNTNLCGGQRVWLGNEGGGSVYVNIHVELRTCDKGRPGAPALKSTEDDLARAVGNTAVHELTHLLVGDLGHSGDAANFMYDPPPGSGGPLTITREQLRQRLAGKKVWADGQRQALIEAIGSGYYSGGQRQRPGE